MANPTPIPPGDGWRKAVVTLGGLAAVTALAVAGRIEGAEALYAAGAMVAGYLGTNLYSRRR